MVAKNEGGECDWRSFIRQIERESGIAMADEGDAMGQCSERERTIRTKSSLRVSLHLHHSINMTDVTDEQTAVLIVCHFFT